MDLDREATVLIFPDLTSGIFKPMAELMAVETVGPLLVGIRCGQCRAHQQFGGRHCERRDHTVHQAMSRRRTKQS